MPARSVAGSALLVAAIATSAWGDEPGDPAAGAQLAIANCAQCHGAADAPGGAPSLFTIAGAPTTTEESLDQFLMAPHSTMTDLKLNWEDRRDLIAYILSLRP